ncbi:uncharacterized protein IWZ02DRAFT_495152 [Phyllosticta citriasiana]|uniref:Uncharacterized protein n=1 Tax=Phyllosticta citriasiana TaxID=595635 RepID=A0ABR1KAI9_9PEZI
MRFPALAGAGIAAVHVKVVLAALDHLGKVVASDAEVCPRDVVLEGVIEGIGCGDGAGYVDETDDERNTPSRPNEDKECKLDEFGVVESR